MKAKQTIESLAPYRAPLEDRRPYLCLDFNENTVGPSPLVVKAIRDFKAEEMSSYPEYEQLVAELADFNGVFPENVAVFNGCDAGIKAVFDCFGERGETFLSAVPTFGYYRPCAEQQGMKLAEIPYQADYGYPWELFKAALKEKPRLFFVCNPEASLGSLQEPEELVRLAEENPETMVVVDETYFDYTGKTVAKAAWDLPNLVALRSFSKAFGLAGIRIGYGIGREDTVERLKKVVGPYDINVVAVKAVRAALKDYGYVQRWVDEVKAAKAWLLQLLSRLDVKVVPGEANYFLLWSEMPSRELCLQLKEKGILVRDMSGKPVIEGSVRVTVGTRDQMKRFFDALKEVLEEWRP